MATAKQARSQAAAASRSTGAKTDTARSGTGAKRDAARSGTGAKRDKGTRGGRPDGAVVAAQARRPAQQAQRISRPAGKPPASAAPPPSSTLIPPLWFQLVTWALSIGGLGVSTYLTIAHYTSSSILACSDKGLVNCGLVTTSAQSVVFGIFPVAVLGLAFYVFMAVVTSPWAWRARFPQLAWARLGSVVIGIAFVLYLVYTELFTLNAICLWCTSVHVITFLLFVLIVISSAVGYGFRERQPIR